mgnify:FL=1
MYQEKNIALVLPAYNEAGSIGVVLDAIHGAEALRGLTIIVVDDGSTDQTAAIVRAKNTTLVQHARNKGLGLTFQTAVTYCLEHGFDAMVFFDADGQFEVQDVPKVLQPLLDQRTDFVLGSRFLNGAPGDIPRMKLLGNHILARFISWVTGTTVRDIACGFRAYSREALFRINISSRFTYTQEVLLDLLFKGLVMQEVPISVRYFKDRHSHISSNLWHYGWRVLKIMVRTIRDYQPMKFFGLIGAGIFFIGVTLDVWMLWFYFSTGSFSPYKIIGFGGAFLNLTGITIWFVGLVADMLNRIHRGQDDLLYLARKKLFDGDK